MLLYKNILRPEVATDIQSDCMHICEYPASPTNLLYLQTRASMKAWLLLSIFALLCLQLLIHTDRYM